MLKSQKNRKKCGKSYRELERELMRDDYLDKKLDRYIIALLDDFLLWKNKEDTIFS
jgi:hypothetical protein